MGACGARSETQYQQVVIRLDTINKVLKFCNELGIVVCKYFWFIST